MTSLNLQAWNVLSQHQFTAIGSYTKKIGSKGMFQGNHQAYLHTIVDLYYMPSHAQIPQRPAFF